MNSRRINSVSVVALTIIVTGMASGLMGLTGQACIPSWLLAMLAGGSMLGGQTMTDIARERAGLEVKDR